ncbi:peptidase S8/S53 domain-containing protein [Cristinia sonorae]|uniref:tripeptidyl-peptidase II n=1 Tax=Cristinia sonorae TaxID=1940300 RepID=A0A8K0XKX4_9AGAR|nr:peptidase S8/S53 domain-containing protein [Cristinia sonorae]
MFPKLLSVVLLALVASASSLTITPHVRHEYRRSIPSGWNAVHRASPTAVLPLRIGLVQPGLEELEKHLLDVSQPESPNYGQHWSAGRVAETFRPSKQSVDTVREWLHSEGIDASRVKLSKSGGWIEATVSVQEAESLLKTHYSVYEHESTGTQHVACGSEYHLPEHVSKHVELVTPTLHFDVKLKREPVEELEKRVSKPGTAKTIGQPGHGVVVPKTTGRINIKSIFQELSQCDQFITPNCLRALYKYVYVPLVPNKNSYAIVEYTPQAYLASDLDLFFKNFSSSQIGQRPNLVSIDGGVVQTDQTGFEYNGESNLDLQFGMALVGKKQPVTLYQVGDIPQGASFNNLLDALDGSYCTFEGGDDPLQDGIYPDPLPGGYKGGPDCGTVKPANVISTSYGYNEADLTPAYTARQCAEYAKLGLMGVTVLYSSGDNGVAGNGALCLNPDGSQTNDGKIFNPSFPGTCPFVTSVGATQVNPGAKVTDPESACMQVIYSGGGFSNYFAMPDYQKSAVKNYLTKFPPSFAPNLWNATGTSRAFPDISANGANYVVAVNGNFSRVFGTSASTPVVGALLTSINDARIAIGKRPIGFINPTIYSAKFAGAWNDVTSGTNPGCGTPGFAATPGWDPVTGLGTPNFAKLLVQWLLLP